MRSERFGRRALLAALAVGLSAVLAACGAGSGSTPAAPPVATASGSAAAGTAPVGTVVMVIRHGEKPDGGDPGVDAQGRKDDSSLTAAGWQRANLLADLLDPASGGVRPGLARPMAIFAAGANDDGEGKRPRETVAPLARRLGVTQNNDYGKGDEEALVERVIAGPGPALICWQHGELPAIAAAFPDVTPTPPGDWPNDRFDVIWTFTRTADGWHFAQQPELLLPHDQDSVID